MAEDQTKQPELAPVGVNALVRRILELAYCPVAPECAGDGAQVVDGQWYMPRWGCDTIQHLNEIADMLFVPCPEGPNS